MFSFGMFPGYRAFNTTYRCFSVSMFPGHDRQHLESGGKIILPPSALEQLTRLNVVYPMMFKLTNTRTSRSTHCGVLEFVADEGKCYIPYWMMKNLLCEEGNMIQIESATLPVASFSKFQPQSVDFLEISSPKAVLENSLRTFACLTTGDVIAIMYNDKIYEMRVLETKPGDAVSIIECDMNVDFAAPVGYVDPSEQRQKESEEQKINDAQTPVLEPSTFIPFLGAGNRLDGKGVATPQGLNHLNGVYKRGQPDFDWEIGTINFMRFSTKQNNTSANQDQAFKPFSGEGTTLRSLKTKD